MSKIQFGKITTSLFLFLTLTMLFLIHGSNVKAYEDFSLKEFKKFHDVLHPLVHDALPAKDFKRIRENACALLLRGQDIVDMDVPKDIEKRDDYTRAVEKFKAALATFKTDAAKSNNDAQLEKSFNDVHDTFEAIAGLLPKKKS